MLCQTNRDAEILQAESKQEAKQQRNLKNNQLI